MTGSISTIHDTRNLQLTQTNSIFFIYCTDRNNERQSSRATRTSSSRVKIEGRRNETRRRNGHWSHVYERIIQEADDRLITKSAKEQLEDSTVLQT